MGKGLCLSTACLCRAGCRDGFTGRDLRGEGQSRRRQLVHRVPPTTSPRPVPFRSPHRGEPTFVPGRPSPATGGVRREPAASSPGSAPAAASPGERHRPPPGLPHIFPHISLPPMHLTRSCPRTPLAFGAVKARRLRPRWSSVRGSGRGGGGSGVGAAHPSRRYIKRSVF